MKTIFFSALLIFSYLLSIAQNNDIRQSKISFDNIKAFKDSLIALKNRSHDEIFKIHYQSILDVINSQSRLIKTDSSLLAETYKRFENSLDTSSMKDSASYMKRERSLVLAWQSPTDGAISFSMLKLPLNWDRNTKYPLYVQLHGLWNVANSPIEYMTYGYRNSPSSSFAYEDGYLLDPWGRGNFWYQGISETDIWEGIAALEKILLVDPTRKYIAGHSMGGYGAWRIAYSSPGTWAALGMHASAIWYDNQNLVNSEVAEQLKDLPTYFVCGNNDGLLSINQTAYALLQQAGNNNIEFVTFEGGHDYIQTNVEGMYLWMREFTNENYTNIAAKQKSGFEVDAYPNPFTDNVTITIQDNQSRNIVLNIYDTKGILLNTYHYRTQTLTVDTKSFPAGVYYYQIVINGTCKSGKLIRY